MSSLEASGKDAFVFAARADRMYQENDPAAERIRMEWLKAWLKEKGLCPGGYVLTQREVFVHPYGAVSSAFDVIYYGRCAPVREA